MGATSRTEIMVAGDTELYSYHHSTSSSSFKPDHFIGTGTLGPGSYVCVEQNPSMSDNMFQLLEQQNFQVAYAQKTMTIGLVESGPCPHSNYISKVNMGSSTRYRYS